MKRSEEELSDKCKRMKEYNRATLSEILNMNQGTKIGKRYHFQDIDTVEKYVDLVPLSTYDDIRQDINDMCAGKENVLTAGEIVSFCMTSGTEGNQKYIPITREALDHYGNQFQEYQNKIYATVGGKRLFMSIFRTNLQDKMEPFLLCSEICYRYMYEEHLLNTEEFLGGTTMLFQKEPGETFYVKVWMAILEENITIMESIFLYDTLLFFNYLEKNWREIVAAIRRKKIADDCVLSAEAKEFLLSMSVDEKRLEKVECECQKGFSNIAVRLWPRLRLISGISTRAFFTENQSLRVFTGDIPQYYFCYCASECYMGANLKENSYEFTLIPGNAFYELLPVGASETICPEEAKIGKKYEVIITNFSGLYRYQMGDMVQVNSFYGESPVLEFAYRKNQAVNIAGEKMSMGQIERAIEQLEKQGIQLSEYCLGTAIDEVPGCYLIAAVLRQDVEADPGKAARIVDESMRTDNPDYCDLRKMKYLECPGIYFLTSENYRKLMRANNLDNGHHKPIHIAPNGFSRTELNQMCRREAYI